MSMSTEDRQLRNKLLVEDFRAHGGEVTTGQYAGRPILLLTTTGAKSGQPRTTPLAYGRDGDRYVVVGSQGGRPTNPDWYYNLLKNPTVTVEVGTETFQARAVEVEGAERERLFEQMAGAVSNLKDYQKKVTRVIPVIVLERLA
jgi:deazaflavin-dependent oxidoreductase (nitroreductase family)